MKKTLLVVGILAIAVLAFGSVSYAFALSETPNQSEYLYGRGMHSMNGFEGMGGLGHGIGSGMDYMGESGPMHDGMVEGLAEALGLSPEEIETRHDAGETMWEIAEGEGLNPEEIQDLMFSTHEIAMEDAVANGWVTEEQTEWMDAHMDQMWSGDFNDGSHCGGGGYNHPHSQWQGENLD